MTSRAIDPKLVAEIQDELRHPAGNDTIRRLRALIHAIECGMTADMVVRELRHIARTVATKPEKPGTVWCVRYREGWCAMAAHEGPPPGGSTHVFTRCGGNVVFPWGFARRVPTCAECLKVSVEAVP